MATTSTIPEPQTERRAFTLRQRIALTFITWAGALAVRLIGPTLRWRVEMEEPGRQREYPHPAIFVCWHRCVLPALYRYRRQDFAIMASSSFDGEYIARIIAKFGLVPVRGSSTRDGARALLGMHRNLEQGRSVVFTIDGPRGPRYVAKPGPVLLARNAGLPIYAFHVAVERAWVLDSWDRFMVPKPFSRVLLRVSRSLHVPAEASADQMQQCHAAMQALLDHTRETSEAQIMAATGRHA